VVAARRDRSGDSRGAQAGETGGDAGAGGGDSGAEASGFFEAGGGAETGDLDAAMAACIAPDGAPFAPLDGSLPESGCVGGGPGMCPADDSGPCEFACGYLTNVVVQGPGVNRGCCGTECHATCSSGNRCVVGAGGGSTLTCFGDASCDFAIASGSVNCTTSTTCSVTCPGACKVFGSGKVAPTVHCLDQALPFTTCTGFLACGAATCNQ